MIVLYNDFYKKEKNSMNIIKKMRMLFILAVFSVSGLSAQDCIDQESLQEKIEFPCDHTDVYQYDKTEKISPMPAGFVQQAPIITKTSHWFTTGFTRTKVTIEPYGQDEIKTITQTWTTKNHSYATSANITGAVVAVVAVIYFGLRQHFLHLKNLDEKRKDEKRKKEQQAASLKKQNDLYEQKKNIMNGLYDRLSSGSMVNIPDSIDINTRFGDGESILDRAVRGGNISLIDQLIKKGARLNNDEDSDQLSPLMKALMHSPKNNKLEVVNLLLDKKADPNYVIKHSKFQSTALGIAVLSGALKEAKALIQAGADPSLEINAWGPIFDIELVVNNTSSLGYTILQNYNRDKYEDKSKIKIGAQVKEFYDNFISDGKA